MIGCIRSDEYQGVGGWKGGGGSGGVKNNAAGCAQSELEAPACSPEQSLPVSRGETERREQQLSEQLVQRACGCSFFFFFFQVL